MGKSSRTYLWAKSNLRVYNLQPLGRFRVLGKGIGEPRLKREGWQGKGGKGGVAKKTLSANEATNVFPGKTSEYLSPQNNKEHSGTLPYPDVLEFHSLAPTPQLQDGLDEGSHLNHLVSQC